MNLIKLLPRAGSKSTYLIGFHLLIRVSVVYTIHNTLYTRIWILHAFTYYRFYFILYPIHNRVHIIIYSLFFQFIISNCDCCIQTMNGWHKHLYVVDMKIATLWTLVVCLLFFQKITNKWIIIISILWASHKSNFSSKTNKKFNNSKIGRIISNFIETKPKIIDQKFKYSWIQHISRKPKKMEENKLENNWLTRNVLKKWSIETHGNTVKRNSVFSFVLVSFTVNIDFDYYMYTALKTVYWSNCNCQ